MPTEHDGKKLFAFEIRFSEEFDGMTLTALKRSLLVSGGRIVDVKRTVRGQNRRVTVRVRPSSHEPVIVALPSTLDCTAAGAICAKDGRKLSTHVSTTITSPAWGWGVGGGGTPYSASVLRSLNPDPPRTAKATIKTVSSSTSTPTGFPTSDTGTVVNMNGFGGGGPSIQLRERYDRGGHYIIDFPCGNPGMGNTCRIGGEAERVTGQTLGAWDGGVDAYGRWFTYPHNAGTNDMKVHLLVRRATKIGKIELDVFFDRGHNVEWFYNNMDFFTANAHLETPTGGGNAVQPTLALNTSATWTGKVIALDTARYFDASKNPNFARRGQLIGGDATITVARHNTPALFATVNLTNLKGANVETTYPDLNWYNMAVTNGSFERENSGSSELTVEGAKVSGTFRGTGAAKVGGTFEVPSHWRWQSGRWMGMVGGFVADKQ